MLRRHLLVTCLFLGLATAPSCGGGGGDQTAKFSGAWTFASGSLTPMCLIASVPPFNLTGLNVMFQKVDDSTISLGIGTSCVVKFHVSGNNAAALAKQTCTLDLGGALGMQSIMVTAWTLTLANDHIDTTIAGMASICTAMGTGVLVHGTTDAGVSAGGHGGSTTGGAGAGGGGAGNGGGAGGSAGSDAGMDTGATDGAAESGADTGTDTSVDAPTAETD